MTYQDYVIEDLNRAWQKYLKELKDCIAGLRRQLELNQEYFESAARKGKTQAQIKRRIRKNEEDELFLQKCEKELEHYSKKNADIESGKIKPTCLIEAYYVLDMPDGTPGYFNARFPLVRKFR